MGSIVHKPLPLAHILPLIWYGSDVSQRWGTCDDHGNGRWAPDATELLGYAASERAAGVRDIRARRYRREFSQCYRRAGGGAADGHETMPWGR